MGTGRSKKFFLGFKEYAIREFIDKVLPAADLASIKILEGENIG